MKQPVKLYIGAYCNDDNVGGYGYIMFINSTTPAQYMTKSGFGDPTTFNRMALKAVIDALAELKVPSEIVIFTEYKHLKQCIDTGWRWLGNPNLNLPDRDLLIELNEGFNLHSYKCILLDKDSGNKYIESAECFARR